MSPQAAEVCPGCDGTTGVQSTTGTELTNRQLRDQLLALVQACVR